MSAVLELSGVSVSFGGLAALSGVGFRVPAGKVTALIGPNGAGKTTCFNVISGLQRTRAGRVVLKGRDLSRVPAHRREGLGRTFQIVQLFAGMTVRESVMVGLHRRGRGALIQTGLGFGSVRRSEAAIRRETDAILDQVGLTAFSRRSVEDLSLGQQRRVELARAMGSHPALLMLDEAASGLSAGELSELEEHIHNLLERGVSVLLVEHNMRFVSRVAHHLVVLEFGKVIFEGAVAEGLKAPVVISAYLGLGASLA